MLSRLLYSGGWQVRMMYTHTWELSGCSQYYPEVVVSVQWVTLTLTTAVATGVAHVLFNAWGGGGVNKNNKKNS